MNASALSDPRFTRGADAFNTGRFFTAHEIWEDLWLETVGPEKLLLQGLVQIAAGYAKVETGVRAGALKLLARGLDRVRQSGSVALDSFADGVAADVTRLQQAPDGAVSLPVVRAPRFPSRASGG